MGELVQLRRHYEVIFVQALDLLRLQRDRGVSPAEADVGVVTFSFGEVANTLRKGKRLGKILELEGSLDPSILIAYCPCGSLAAKSFYCVFIDGAIPPRQGVQDLLTRGSGFADIKIAYLKTSVVTFAKATSKGLIYTISPGSGSPANGRTSWRPVIS
jgi:hypothetical protein